MTISARIILDSFSKRLNSRITTMELEYPRFIHAEFMTHRVFSRNASSSRAIPVNKMIEIIKLNPAMPIHWGKNQPGMQAHEELDAVGIERAKSCWLMSMALAVEQAQHMHDIGAHKQIVNRILEPFSHMRVLVTATDWQNFFVLRDHEDAQPEIRELAVQMKAAMEASIPVPVACGEWHLPYITEDDIQKAQEHLMKRRITRDIPPAKERYQFLCAISAARCARVSYLNHDGSATDIEKDLELYHRLVQANPPHMSPCEHQATPMESHGRDANFRDWIQFRSTIHGNVVYG